MKTKESTDVVHVKTGRKLEEIMSTRGKALVLKCDKNAMCEKVKWFTEHRNEKKIARGKYFMKYDLEILEKSVNAGVIHPQIITCESSSANNMHAIALTLFLSFTLNKIINPFIIKPSCVTKYQFYIIN